MSDLLIIGGFLAFGVVVAAAAWRKLEAEEHDVLHTHPKLVVTLIVCGTLILGSVAVGVRYSAEGLRLVESAVNPEGEVAKRGAEQQIYVVADIQAVSIAAASCAQQHEGVDAIRDCVVDEVERQTGSPPLITLRTTTTRPGG